MSEKKLAPTSITKEQREWLEQERDATCNSFSVIIRGLIQEKVNKSKKQKAGA